MPQAMHQQLFRIGDVARLFGVSVQTLRHYDDIGLLKPEATDPDTGYRYYSIAQFESLNTIRYLRACGMPLGSIKGFFDRKSPESMVCAISEQIGVLDSQIESLSSMREKLRLRKSRIEEALGAVAGEVEMRWLGPRRFAMLKTSIAPKGHLDLELSLREIHGRGCGPLAFLGKVGVGISLDHLREHEFECYDFVFIELDDVEDYPGETVDLSAGDYLVIRFEGGHQTAPAHYELLLDEAARRGLAPCGSSKEMVLIDEGISSEPSRSITEIQIPVRRCGES